MLQDEGHPEAKCNPQGHGYAERQQKDADPVEQRRDIYFRAVKLRQRSAVRCEHVFNDVKGLLYLLIHDDTDRIVEQTLSKDDSVQLRVNLVLIEYRQDGDGICGGERRPENQALDERYLERL